MFSSISVYFLVFLTVRPCAADTAIGMEVLNWVVDEDGNVQGYVAGGGALMLKCTSTGHTIPPEPDEIDNAVDFKWDADPMVREVYLTQVVYRLPALIKPVQSRVHNPGGLSDWIHAPLLECVS